MPHEDDKVWTAYAKGVKRLKPGPASKNNVISAKPFSASLRAEPSPAKRESPGASRREGGEGIHVPLDRNLEKRLRQGAIVPEARLDLHGMKQAEAHAALENFLSAQVKRRRRLLLIITGKGRNGPGVLRANLSNWLAASDQAGQILALRPAAIRHGGQGAAYVLLKKRKDKDAD